MLFITPPTLDVDITATQVRKEVFLDQNTTASSTCLEGTYQISPKDFDSPHWEIGNVFSTVLSLDNLEEQKNATWEEENLNEFDLVANNIFNKTIKVKSKIKSVTKYKPDIIID